MTENNVDYYLILLKLYNIDRGNASILSWECYFYTIKLVILHDKNKYRGIT